tara:strand:- start:267 stop:461 length:195 start_codon:yes stop_codon:yes gene_type:complete
MNKEIKSPKKEWHLDHGVSEYDFHLARSKDQGYPNVSHLERIALIDKSDDIHPMLLGTIMINCD